MQHNKSFNNKENWQSLVDFVSEKFGKGEQLDLQAILFLIGVHELGQGYREFSKKEKEDLLHIAICKLLSQHGYYEFTHRDKEGWPHWKTNNNMVKLQPDEQTALLKEGSIRYFLESGIKF